MSLEAYIWAANLPLSRCNGTPFRVLLQLADRADAHGYHAFPSVETIAENLECSERTVQRALKTLRDDGLIRLGNQDYVAHIRPDKRPIVYDVVTTALTLKERYERGDNYVTPSLERGDSSCPSGVTTVVTQTALEPTYQDSPTDLTLVTARESEMTR